MSLLFFSAENFESEFADQQTWRFSGWQPDRGAEKR